jgi:hypothetical protein
LSFLQFAVYNSGLPYDPPAGAADPMLENVSSIQATGGASLAPYNVPPFNNGGGDAITEFDNLPTPGFFAPNDYSGHYLLKLAGLQGQPSVWSVDDVHLVFGSPVNLDYHIIETASQYTNVDISCGTNVINNITNCFGLVTYNVINTTFLNGGGGNSYDSVYLTVSGIGPGYTVPAFKVYYNGAFPNSASIPLFLPAGIYTISAWAMEHIGTFASGVNNVGYSTIVV